MIVLPIGEMDGTAADRTSSRPHRLVDEMAIIARPAKAGNQRRMNIDYRPRQAWRRPIELEITGETDDIDLVSGERRIDGGIVAAVEGWIAVALGLTQPESVSNIADHHLDMGGKAALFNTLVKIVERATTAREQNRDFQHRLFSAKYGCARASTLSSQREMAVS